VYFPTEIISVSEFWVLADSGDSERIHNTTNERDARSGHTQ